jgi:hypothetical protein
MATAFIRCLCQRYRPRGQECVLYLAKLLGSLVNCGLRAHGGHLSTLFLGKCHMPAAVLLIAQACKGGLTLLVPQSLADELDVEAAAAKPQEDGAGGRPFSCLGSAFGQPLVLGNAPGKEVFGKKQPSLLAGTSGLLIKKLLAAGSLLAGMSGFLLLLAEKLLAAGSLLASANSSSLLVGASGSSLLAGTSGLLVKELLAMALVRPQVVDCPLPIHVGAFHAGAGPMKNGPPPRGWRQQPSGLLVFVECSLMPFLILKGATNVGRGVVGLIVGKQPVGGAGGRLRPFVSQPPFRIREGGRGQMSRRGSTFPHGVVVGSVHLVRVPT